MSPGLRRSLAGSLLVLVLASLFLLLFLKARERGRLHHCRNNLRQLGRLALQLRSEIDPELRGRRFWQSVRELQYRDVRGAWRPIDPDPFVCPVLGTTVSDRDRPEAIDYLGPGYDFRTLQSSFPVGADREGNHGAEGYVLLHDTSIREIPLRILETKIGGSDWSEARPRLSE